MLKKRSAQSNLSNYGMNLPFNEFDLWARAVKRQMIAAIKKRDLKED